MGARDPAGGSIVTSDESTLSLGGPLGVFFGLALFVIVAVVVVVVVTGLEAALAPFVPQWLVLPVVLLTTAILVGAGLWALLRFNEWRR